MNNRDRYPNTWTIVSDHFSPVQDRGQRHVSLRQLFYYFFIPSCISALLVTRVGEFPVASIDSMIAVQAIVASVLTSVLGLTQSLISGIRIVRNNGDEAERRRSRQVIRIQLLRQVYAAIAFSVIVILLCLVFGVVLRSRPGDVIAIILSALIYFCCAISGVVFFDLIVALYVVLDERAEQSESGRDDSQGDSV